MNEYKSYTTDTPANEFPAFKPSMLTTEISALSREPIPKGAANVAGLSAVNDQPLPITLYPEAHENDFEGLNPEPTMAELLERARQKIADETPEMTEWLKKSLGIDEPPTVDFSFGGMEEMPIDDGYFAENEHDYFQAPTNWKQELNTHMNDFNSKFAVVLHGSKTLVMKTLYDDDRNRNERIYLSTQSLNMLYSNEKIKVGEKVVKDDIVDIVKTKSSAWLDNPRRLSYRDGITFKPSRYLNGVEVKAQISSDKFNLWEGYSVQPIENNGALDVLKYHISQIVCSGNVECYEYLMNWIARGLQYPELTGQVAVALKGEKGCGKGTLGNFVKKLYGQHGLQVTNPKHLTGNFNAHMADCCFLFADEVIFAGDKQTENIMKGLITEDTMMIERKGIDAECMTNRLKILMASNNDWIAPVSKDERRYFVLDVSSEKIGDTDYFKQLHKAINSIDTQQAFLYEMLHRDISGFNVGKVPDTAALKEQRAQSLDTFGQYWIEALQRGYIYQSQYNNHDFNDWIAEPSTALIKAGYAQWCNQHKIGTYGIVKTIGNHLSNWYKKSRHGGYAMTGETLKGEVATISRPNCYVVGSRSMAIESFCEFEKLNIEEITNNLE